MIKIVWLHYLVIFHLSAGEVIKSQGAGLYCTMTKKKKGSVWNDLNFNVQESLCESALLTKKKI